MEDKRTYELFGEMWYKRLHGRVLAIFDDERVLAATAAAVCYWPAVQFLESVEVRPVTFDSKESVTLLNEISFARNPKRFVNSSIIS